jgi:hypothetical protein
MRAHAKPETRRDQLTCDERSKPEKVIVVPVLVCAGAFLHMTHPEGLRQGGTTLAKQFRSGMFSAIDVSDF